MMQITIDLVHHLTLEGSCSRKLALKSSSLVPCHWQWLFKLQFSLSLLPPRARPASPHVGRLQAPMGGRGCLVRPLRGRDPASNIAGSQMRPTILPGLGARYVRARIGLDKTRVYLDSHLPCPESESHESLPNPLNPLSCCPWESRKKSKLRLYAW